MKKIFTLLWLALSAFSFRASAQTNLCNAEFSVQYINSSTVKFNPVINIDTPAYKHFWSFGDGSAVSNAVSPTHVYTLPGTYAAVHTIIRYNNNNVPECTQSFTRTVVVQTVCNLQANFTWSNTTVSPLTVAFHNTSTPSHTTDSVRWTFGDGSSVSGVQGDSAVANPVHTYANAGTYNVCIRVKKNNNTTSASCVREYCQTIVVPQPCNLVVNFSWTVSQNNPLRIGFHNFSVPLSNTDSIKWTFGDGTSSAAVNPVHIYNTPGTYTVCLRVKKNGNTGSTTPCVREICKTIVVPQLCNVQAAFTWRLDSANHRKVYFTNHTNAPTAASTATWTFGDGSSATTWNAVHEYAQPGIYRVCLRVVSAPNCVAEICDTVIIPNPSPACNQLSKFRFEKFGNDNQKYKFVPDYLNNSLQYTWTFGDGTGSHDPVAIHRYAQPGVYTACLTVWRGPNCASTTCREVVVRPQINCDSVQVTYTYQRNPQVPNKIHFYASGSVPILDQTWIITKLPVSTTNSQVILHQNNPVYTFPDTGYYRVCLRAITLGGCVKEYCSVIRIEHVGTNACLLQPYPNPASNIVNVDVYLQQPETIHAYLYNSLNVLIKDKHQQGHTGNNIVSFAVNDLPAGQYTIKLVYGNSVCYARFLKL
ncbi:MAG: PKD domain-containing protein [Ferruginibacter sp.]